jgi:hypothetical protein
MIKETVTYKDFNEEMQTEDLYFHLSKSELVELELGMDGGLGTYLQTLVKSRKTSELLAAFKNIISAAYGERSLDGKRFVKNEEKTKEFLASPAYDALFMRLVTDEAAVTEFILGVVPKDLITEAGGADKLLSGAAVSNIALPETPFTVTGDKDMRPMTDEELGKRMQLPAAFRRPPAERVPPGTIVLPAELQNITREELLRAYDQQMDKTRKNPEPPSPPAA